MCVVSAVGDDWSQRWPYPKYPPLNPLNPPPTDGPIFTGLGEPAVTRKEWEEIWEELKSLKEILIKAKQYDDAHNEPNCEMEEKIALIKKFGEIFSIDFRGIFDKEIELPQPSDDEFFRVISPIEGELARFSDKLLADKFADYISKYRKEEGIVVIEVHPVKLETLRYAVFVNNVLNSAFVTHEDANEFAMMIKDAASLFNNEEPSPEVRIVLI